MNSESEQLVLCFFHSGSLKEELTCVNKLILHVSKQSSHFVDVLELMSPYILGQDKPDEEMVRSFKLIGEILAKVKNLELTEKQKDLLIGYFIRSMKKLAFVEVASRCLEILLTDHMLAKDEASSKAGYARFLELLEGDYWLTSAYVQPIRHRVYSCLLSFLKLRPKVIEGSESRFIKLVIEHSGEEKDPRNLFVVLGIWNQVLALCPKEKVAQYVENIFENISVYFPIIFKNKSSTSSITVEDLNEALNRCLSHESMVDQFVTLIFQKMLDGEEDVRQASINGLVFVLEDGFNGRVLQNVHVLRTVISNMQSLSSEMRDHPDVKRVHRIVVQLLDGGSLKTESRVLSQMLARYLEDFLRVVREKPSSSDAHHHVSILREMMEDMPPRAKKQVLEIMWLQVSAFFASGKKPSMKIMVEHLILVSAKRKAASGRHEKLSAEASSKIFAVLLELLSDESYDLRMMALMCMKMTCHLLVDDGSLLSLKSKLLLNMRTAEETESRCCVEVYFLVFNQQDVPEVEQFLAAAEDKKLDGLMLDHKTANLKLHAYIMHLKQNPPTDRMVLAFVQLLLHIFDSSRQEMQADARPIARDMLPYMKSVSLAGRIPPRSLSICSAVVEAVKHMLAVDSPTDPCVYEVLESLIESSGVDAAPLVCACLTDATANLGLLQHLLKRLRIPLPAPLLDSAIDACIADEGSRLHGLLQSYLSTASLSPEQSQKLARHCCRAPDERKVRYLKSLMNQMIDHVFSDVLQVLPDLFCRPALLRLLLGCGEEDNRLAVYRLYSSYLADVRPTLDLQTRTKVDIIASDLLEYARSTVSIPDILSFVEAFHGSLDSSMVSAITSLLLRFDSFDKPAVDRLFPLVELLADEEDIDRCVGIMKIQMKLVPLATAADRRRILASITRMKGHKKRIVRRHACDCYNEYICAFN